MVKKYFKIIFPILLVALYAMMVLRIYFSGKVTFFVHPDFAIAILMCGAFLLLLTFLLISGIGKIKSDLGASHSFTANAGKTFLAVLPILMFLIFPIKPLSSQAFLSRSIDSAPGQFFSRKTVQTPEFIINTENRSLIDWIRLFSQSTDYDNFISLKAKLTGFVLKDDQLPEGYFVLARFVISCCAADARPIGLTVKYDQNFNSFQADEWLEVTGKFVVEELNGQKKPVLIIDNAKKIDTPDNPYIS